MESQIISVLIICIFVLCFTAIRQSKQYRSEIRKLEGKLSNQSDRLETLTLEIKDLRNQELQRYNRERKENQELQRYSRELRRYELAVLGNQPPELDHNDPYWREMSNYCKAEKRWTCEACGIYLGGLYDNLYDRYYLDTHHKLGRGYNSPHHLKVLCVGCHAEEKEPMDHSFMKTDKRYIAFRNKYRK